MVWVRVRVKIRYFAFRNFTFRCCAFSLKCAFAICAFRSCFSLKKPFADMLFAQRTPYHKNKCQICIYWNLRKKTKDISSTENISQKYVSLFQIVLKDNSLMWNFSIWNQEKAQKTIWNQHDVFSFFRIEFPSFYVFLAVQGGTTGTQ